MYKIIISAVYLLIILTLPRPVLARDSMKTLFNRDTLLVAAKELIASTPYCALITLDTTGYPVARTMDPFPPDKKMVVWLGTNKNSRKVQEIKNDSHVTLYYADSKGMGYVLIMGYAYLVDDQVKKQAYWKNEWDRFYSEQKSEYILIKVVPFRLEILDYGRGIVGDPQTWSVPFVEFNTD
jgi:general stress protein 26